MSRLLMGAIGRLYLRLFLGLLGAVLVVYLVGDFADRLGAYLQHPATEVAELYWNKLLVALHQLAPAAMLLAGGATVSTLRQRGEWTAMQALGLSRVVILAPVAALTLTAALALVGFDEWVVTRAGPRVDTLMATRFNRWGDFRFFYAPHQWFRLQQHLVQVRGEAEGGALGQVTVFEVGEGFQLRRRVDVATLTHLRGSTWLATDVHERRFTAPGQAPLVHHNTLDLVLPGSSGTSFEVKPGRAEFMPTALLRRQLQVRAQLGLPTQRLVLALHNRFAYPATGFAATMLALALALRPSRRGHLTLALVEGLVVTVSLFGLLLVGKALVLGEHVSAALSAWAPAGALLLGSGALWWRAEHPQASARR